MSGTKEKAEVQCYECGAVKANPTLEEGDVCDCGWAFCPHCMEAHREKCPKKFWADVKRLKSS